MREKIQCEHGTSVVFNAIDVIGTPFFIFQEADIPVWVITHRPTRHALGRYGWSSSDLALSSIRRWWNLLATHVQEGWDNDDITEVMKVDPIIVRMLWATTDCKIIIVDGKPRRPDRHSEN